VQFTEPDWTPTYARVARLVLHVLACGGSYTIDTIASRVFEGASRTTIHRAVAYLYIVGLVSWWRDDGRGPRLWFASGEGHIAPPLTISPPPRPAPASRKESAMDEVSRAILEYLAPKLWPVPCMDAVVSLEEAGHQRLAIRRALAALADAGCVNASADLTYTITADGRDCLDAATGLCWPLPDEEPRPAVRPSLSEHEAAVLSVLLPSPRPFADIAEASGLSLKHAATGLLLLEVKGIACRLVGDRFQLIT
jgi:hypothetical protein